MREIQIFRILKSASQFHTFCQTVLKSSQLDSEKVKGFENYDKVEANLLFGGYM